MRTGTRWTTLVMILIAAGCAKEPEQPKDTGEQFVGTWVATTDRSAVMHIEKDHDFFIIRFEGNAEGHGLGLDNATGAYKDGALVVRRAGLSFTFSLDAKSGELATGFKPPTFRRRLEGETPAPEPKPATLPKL